MTANMDLSAVNQLNKPCSDTTLQSMYQDVLALFASIADAVGVALLDVDDWGPSGLRDGQYAAFHRIQFSPEAKA